MFFALVALAAAVWYLTLLASPNVDTQKRGTATLADGAIVTVQLPVSFSQQEEIGQRAYDAVCATCHGANAQGRDGIAPPLVHKVYKPGHHGDMAFVLAAKNGVRAHHWKFGNMPAVEDVTQADVLNIVAYVRALQRENGIN
jgi:mono/diheme cytochrome c family protein